MEGPLLTVVAGETPRRHRFRRPDDVYQLRVSLLEINPPIWRRLLVAQDVPLPRLHNILQATMGWKDRHLHQFKVGDVLFAEPGVDYQPGPIDHAGVTLNRVLRGRRRQLRLRVRPQRRLGTPGRARGGASRANGGPPAAVVRRRRARVPARGLRRRARLR
jgi:hypothetical protein